MANNLHISYDLKNPGQNYNTVIEKIKTLGAWAKIHYSFWYVKSPFSAEQARDALASVLDANDSVYVVDATNNNAAWNILSAEVSSQIQGNWGLRNAA